MEILFNILGLLMTMGAVGIVAQAAASWRGFLRDALMAFLGAFTLFSLGFLWNTLTLFGLLTGYNIDLVFFSLGAALLLMGAKKFFVLQNGPPGTAS
jgi:hypothetical protein